MNRRTNTLRGPEGWGPEGWSPQTQKKLALEGGVPKSGLKPPGFHTTTREPKRAHFRVPVFKNTTKIQREDTQRETIRSKMGGGREKNKSEVLGGPAEGGPGKSKPTTTTTTPNPEQVRPKGWGPRRVGPLSQGSGFGSLGFGLFGFRNFGQNTKVGLAKVGQQQKTRKLAKVGLAKVGHDRQSTCEPHDPHIAT